MIFNYMIRVNASDFIINSDYKILSASFIAKVVDVLAEKLNMSVDEIPVTFITNSIKAVNDITLDEYGNYDYSFVNGIGTLKRERVIFVDIMK